MKRTRKVRETFETVMDWVTNEQHIGRHDAFLQVGRRMERFEEGDRVRVTVELLERRPAAKKGRKP